MPPQIREESGLSSGASAGKGRGEHRFAGLIYIDQDGIEREAPDIPTIAAHIRDGGITGSTLIRSTPEEPWRRAEIDPSVAELLSLVGSNTASAPSSQRAV